MTAATFVQQVERKYDVALVMDHRRFHVLGYEALPRHVRLAVAGHRDQIVAWLVDRVDEELRIAQCADELRALGLCQVETGRWTHPLGDHVMDALLAGLLDPAETPGFVPPRESARPEDVEDLKETAPGTFTWTERRAHRYRDPFPTITRI